jgi:hypothetical protein
MSKRIRALDTEIFGLKRAPAEAGRANRES